MTKPSKAGSARPAAARNWYRVHAKGGPNALAANEAEILVFGDIGDDWYGEESVTAKQLIEDLNGLGDGIEYLTVRVNSYGGRVSDGLAIYNALRRHPAAVTVVVEGVAVSIASLIAMAGDTVMMPANTLMMIHAPWGITAGNARDLRQYADTLDTYSEAMATSYAAKTGRPVAEMLELLQDGEDHWYTAAEAVEEGFADTMTQELAAAASLRMDRFTIPAAIATGNPAAPAASSKEDVPMPEKNQAKTPQADGNTPEPQGAHDNVTAIEQAAEAKVQARIKERNEAVRARFAPFMSHTGVRELYDAVVTDPAITSDQAGEKLLAKLAEGAEPLTPKGHAPRIDAGQDERDKRREACSAALMTRAGVASKEIRAKVDGQNPFRGMKLLDVARDCLDRAGVRTRGMSQMEVVAAAFTQSTSDFPILLEDAMHKTLQGAYAVQPDTWSRFCARGSVSDFRSHNRYRVGSLGNLDKINELGEFRNKTIPDGEKGSIQADTVGNIINLSRKTIVNDDLGAFIGLSSMLGRAAARTVEQYVYSLLLENGGLGPTQADGQPLFHANRSNVGTGSALSVEGIEADRAVMAQQKDVSSNDYLDLRPAVLLVPTGLGGTARVINDAQYDPDTAGKLQRPNMVRGLFGDIVDTPRLSGTRRYLFADPAEAPVIEVAFLDGQENPFLEVENGFSVDGVRYKVRHDFGVADVDYRGAVTNAGA